MEAIKYRSEIDKLVQFIRMQNFRFEHFNDRCVYEHMSAVIVDSILQAGMNYDKIVLPRVRMLIEKYDDFRTTEDFLVLIQAKPLGQLINWRNEEKLDRIRKLTWYFYERRINQISDLQKWLRTEDNLMNLRLINGIGPKTVDYMKKLVGIDTFAVDRHLFKFLELSGVNTTDYVEAFVIYENASLELDIDKWILDKAIWDLMSTRGFLQLKLNL